MIKSLFGSPAPPSEPGLLERLKAGIQKTRAGLMEKLEDAVSGRKEIDAEVLDELEYALITADIGSKTTTRFWSASASASNVSKVADIAELKGPDPRTSARNSAGHRARSAARSPSRPP